MVVDDVQVGSGCAAAPAGFSVGGCLLGVEVVVVVGVVWRVLFLWGNLFHSTLFRTAFMRIVFMFRGVGSSIMRVS